MLQKILEKGRKLCTALFHTYTYACECVCVFVVVCILYLYMTSEVNTRQTDDG